MGRWKCKPLNVDFLLPSRSVCVFLSWPRSTPSYPASKLCSARNCNQFSKVVSLLLKRLILPPISGDVTFTKWKLDHMNWISCVCFFLVLCLLYLLVWYIVLSQIFSLLAKRKRLIYLDCPRLRIKFSTAPRCSSAQLQLMHLNTKSNTWTPNLRAVSDNQARLSNIMTQML